MEKEPSYRVYKYEGSWYWEDSIAGRGPFNDASDAARDLHIHLVVRENCAEVEGD